MRHINRKPLTKQQQQLAMTCYHLAMKEAQDYWQRNPQMDLDECREHAWMALVYAARGFKKKHRVRFSTYAVTAIRQRFVNEWQQSQRQCRKCPTRLFLASDLELPNRGESWEDAAREWWAGSVTDPEPVERLYQLEAYCEPEDWDLLWKRFVLGWQLEDIGRSLARPVSKERTRQKLNRAVQRLREKLPPEYAGCA